MTPMRFLTAIMASLAAMPLHAAGEPPQARPAPTHLAEDAGKINMPEKRVFSTAPPPVRPFGLHGQVAWDHFDHRGNRVWGCRDIGSGEFVVNRLCRDKPRKDEQWPGMGVPSSYRGILVD